MRIDLNNVAQSIINILTNVDNIPQWSKSWEEGFNVFKPLNWKGVKYNGINIFILAGTALAKGYFSPYWMTFKQAKDMGAHIKAGETGTWIIFYSPGGEDDDGNRIAPQRRSYCVFNVAQIEGLGKNYYTPKLTAKLSDEERIAHIEDFYFTRIDSYIRFSPTYSPMYIPSLDLIHMPEFKQFKSAIDYYQTLGHECIHWTKHETRLNRNLDGRAMEELVAEIGSFLLNLELGLQPRLMDDSIPYIKSWVSAIKEKETAIIKAVNMAIKAKDYLLSLTNEENND